jgi:beta-lactamase regulating signal transducer with metallopeptidase domain
VTGAIRIVGGVVLLLTALAHITEARAVSAVWVAAAMIAVLLIIWAFASRAHRAQGKAIQHELHTEAMADAQHRLDLEYWHDRHGSRLEATR